jgi:hypothetical protein
LDLGRSTVTDAFGASREVELSRETPLSIFPIYAAGVDAARVTLQTK